MSAGEPTPEGDASGPTRLPGLEASVWRLPAGTVGAFALDPADTDEDALPGELLWTRRAATVPATRAVVVLETVTEGGVGAEFEEAHRAAEVAASALSTDDDEIGPVEVAVFRSGAGHAPAPESAPGGAAVRTPVRGALATLEITPPSAAGDANGTPAHAGTAPDHGDEA